METAPELKQSYEIYQNLHEALMKNKSPQVLASVIDHYQPNGAQMDIAVIIKLACSPMPPTRIPTAPLEGINCLIKPLIRSCFGFKTLCSSSKVSVRSRHSTKRRLPKKRAAQDDKFILQHYLMQSRKKLGKRDLIAYFPSLAFLIFDYSHSHSVALKSRMSANERR
ncbi:hypothetical protein [Lacticaseibacillus paracasei]|uniref:hypothetical protein n=1 Tax=Lacticaseibacillus paracasei TaxID=1597 RepID=UPI003DA7DC37